jgi:hypothetical protein
MVQIMLFVKKDQLVSMGIGHGREINLFVKVHLTKEVSLFCLIYFCMFFSLLFF